MPIFREYKFVYKMVKAFKKINHFFIVHRLNGNKTATLFEKREEELYFDLRFFFLFLSVQKLVLDVFITG